jgi:hypothetical protein
MVDKKFISKEFKSVTLVTEKDNDAYIAREGKAHTQTYTNNR